MKHSKIIFVSILILLTFHWYYFFVNRSSLKFIDYYKYKSDFKNSTVSYGYPVNDTGLKEFPLTTISPDKVSSLHPECNFIEGKNIIVGQLNTNTSYAVFSTTSSSSKSLNFIFYMPLTVLAWKRIGFGSVVVIVGFCDNWFTNPLLNFVLQTLIKLQAVMVFLSTTQENEVMLSQVSRLFVANILLKKFPKSGKVYVVSSDIDLWPLNKEAFTLTPGKSILSLNSECCAPFKHEGKVYKMLPLSNVGMSVDKWVEVMTKFNLAPSTAEEIILYMLKEFGYVALRNVRKGHNVGWYLDQQTVSMALDRQQRILIKYVPRSTGVDRLDKGQFGGNFQIDDKIDAHLPDSGFKKNNWKNLKRLLKLMYGKESDTLKFCTNYYLEFLELL